jgi:hypothetical protein
MGSANQAQAGKAGRQQKQPDDPNNAQGNQFVWIAGSKAVGTARLDETQDSEK